MKKIESEDKHQAILIRKNELLEAKPDTHESDELNKLADFLSLNNWAIEIDSGLDLTSKIYITLCLTTHIST